MLFGIVKKIKPGYTGAVVSSKGISYLCFPQKSENKAKEAIRKHLRGECVKLTFTRDPVWGLWESLEGYFQGELKTLDFPLDLNKGTDFERTVWETTRTIPYGKTRNYGWLAKKCGRSSAYRAVGNALGKNPVPLLIPCHRVIRSDGGLGGFGAGIHWKRLLLELEKGHKI